MNSIYMNHYVNIMEDLDNKSDIPSDFELLLFSESEEEEEEIKPDLIGLRTSSVQKKRKKKPKSNI